MAFWVNTSTNSGWLAHTWVKPMSSSFSCVRENTIYHKAPYCIGDDMSATLVTETVAPLKQPHPDQRRRSRPCFPRSHTPHAPPGGALPSAMVTSPPPIAGNLKPLLHQRSIIACSLTCAARATLLHNTSFAASVICTALVPAVKPVPVHLIYLTYACSVLTNPAATVSNNHRSATKWFAIRTP